MSPSMVSPASVPAGPAPRPRAPRAARLAGHGGALLLVGLAVYLFLAPAVIIVHDLREPGLRSGAIPAVAFRLHRRLAPRYERWARARITSGRAEGLSLADIAGTEWPLFGSVFFLWGSEALQAAWERDPSLAPRAPREAARGAIAAAVALVADERHAGWVKRHWGDDYLSREDVAYRSFLVGALTAGVRLLGKDGVEPRLRALLREQVDGLAAELDRSPHGLLDDYPGECYPADVLAAVAMIRHADTVLGSDHSAFVARARRGFEGACTDEARGLPPYAADARAGRPLGPARGCSNAYLTLKAPELWPETARAWYEAHERGFWQERLGAAGFREFPRDLPGHDWYLDVDAGPVVAGFGFAASAFGTGAARVNGRLDHGYALASQMIAISWPLPDGTLLGPRLLSNAVDAPYLGEAAILYILTRTPQPGVAIRPAGKRPAFVAILLGLYVGIGVLLLGAAWRRWRAWRRRSVASTAALSEVRWPWLQAGLWLAFVTAGGIAIALRLLGVGLLLLFVAQVVPRARRTRR